MFSACKSNQKESVSDQISGELRIIHAGSMSVPVKLITKDFMKKYPNVKILTEAWGSKAGARRITDLNQDCDIYISADYKIIDELLIPEYSDWNIKFAGNEMAIVYTDKSKHSDIIDQDNWFEILFYEDVIFARSDPDSDPCGYRAIIVADLAEMHYKLPGFKTKILTSHLNYIRPKETDLIAFLEQGAVDYIFLYRSVAEQHNLKYITLPDEINLRNPNLDSLYLKGSVEVNGNIPGEIITEYGEAMVYGITIPKIAKNEETAIEFLKFFLDYETGQKIIEAQGQTSLVPTTSSSYDNVPEELQEFCRAVY
jgi:molybdate/tungstate transport system substrate-binding protein